MRSGGWRQPANGENSGLTGPSGRDVMCLCPASNVFANICPKGTLSCTMRLDATDLRYVTPDEFRVLTAVRALAKPSEAQYTIFCRHHERTSAKRLLT